MVIFKDKLMVRHQGVKETLAVEIDTESMSITESGATALKIDEEFGYNWKEERVPQEGEE